MSNFSITIDELAGELKPKEVLLRLQAHAMGRGDMSDDQIKAAALLLSKCVPNLASLEVNETKTVRVLTDEQLTGRIAELIAQASAGAAPGPVGRTAATH